MIPSSARPRLSIAPIPIYTITQVQEGNLNHTVRFSRKVGIAGLAAVLALMAGCAGPPMQDKSIWGSQPGWSYVGDPGFSPGAVGSMAIAINPADGAPCVAFKDWSSNTGLAWRLSGGQWVQVGSGPFSLGDDVDSISLAFRPTDQRPYVAFRDPSQSNFAAVASFDGTLWSFLGGGMATLNDVDDNTAIVFDSTGLGVVGFGDIPVAKVSVGTYTGSWGYYLPGTGQGISSGGYANITMNVDSSDRFSIAYVDYPSSKATELYFDGASWVPMPGSITFTPSSVWHLHSAVSPTGQQYVVFADGGMNQMASVMSYAGSWSFVGPRGFSPGQISGASITIDSHGTPWVAFLDNANNGSVTVMKYDGSKWAFVGRPGFTAASAGSLSMAFGPGDVPLVAFQDPANGFRASVMSYR
jgi:hypothetical protein